MSAKKSLGQHFLVDRRTVRRIVEAIDPSPDDVVIEIGPGTGALTRLLLPRCSAVIAIEIDDRLVDHLRLAFAGSSLEVVHADALDLDWPSFVSGLAKDRGKSPRIRLAGNLPYYVSTAIIERLLRLKSTIRDMTFMVQKEVADRITSEPGGREYGYLSVLVQLYCETEKVLEVGPFAFRPPPKVRSAVIRLRPRVTTFMRVDDEARFLALVRACFASRRKTLGNNLKASAATLGVAADAIERLCSSGMDCRRRAETLSVAEFGRIYEALFAPSPQEPV